MFDLTGKVAVITGSSRGIGRAIAEMYAKAGAKIVVSSRKAPACDEVVASIRAAGGDAITIPCNIGSKDDCARLITEATAHYGKIDILVCNAAVNPYFGPIESISDEAYDKIMNSNVRSNLWLCQQVIPQMKERKDGTILIVSSIGGLRGSDKLGVYCISKAADMQLVRNLAVELGPHNIRANAIAPGLIRTDFARALWENPKIYEASTRNCPLRRIGEPNEIAGAALYLASNEGRFCTGHTMVIDGGVTIGDAG
jgi:NAD(P)-dependent dehydrogenase (short-subunit alcohol dehydrogenase family)